MKKIARYAQVKKNRFFYVMLIPIAIYFILFNYYPLALGVYSSFHETKILGGSTFVGLENYAAFWQHPNFQQAFTNTLIVGVLSFLLQFATALVLALMINEIKSKFFKSAIQTVTYLPYLLSWSIVGGIWMNLLSPTGFVNAILRQIIGPDFRPIVFMADPRFARTIMVLSSGWKQAGYYAVLLLAAIVAIDPTLYEAASIDGASRFKQIRSIVVPSIVPTIKIVVVLGTMGLLRNFDQIFVMSRASIDPKVRNMLGWVFNQGIEQFKIGLATAAATFILIATMVLSTVVRKLVRYDETYE